MKTKLLLFAMLLAGSTLLAQAPQSMSYQAVVRDGAGALLASSPVGVQISILQGSSTGTPVYVETQTITTNTNGLMSMSIGSGIVVSGTMAGIDWSAGPYFMKTETDPTGGSTYTISGTTELLSVPYALHAGNTFSGDYGDLTNQPTVPTLTSDLTNDLGFITNPDDADANPTNELNTSIILNGTTLETTDAGGTILTDLSSLSGGGGNWTLTGTDITNNNTGNVGIGSPTPIHLVEIGSTDSTSTLSIGHMGGFNNPKASELIFSEDLDYNALCGIKFQHNGAANDLYLIGGCSIEDTIARFNRNGPSNFQQMRIGNQTLTNPTSTLTVDGDILVNGNINVTGNIAKGGGTFKIDHPQDPENKYLIHSFVESPEMMNIYSGNIVTDASGYATVQLPAYFEAANKDFRYQLTSIGTFAQAIVKEKIANNSFVIQTNTPNVEVSWSVTGVRSDKFANENRVVPELEKEHKGTYIHPELYGKSSDQQETKAIEKELLKQKITERANRSSADGQ